ncbi:unnamed protein product [Peniophora sp. CBMAI 1063]|nr:unnamed protein product [Peniophora sp. CBMAI 1063]
MAFQHPSSLLINGLSFRLQSRWAPSKRAKHIYDLSFTLHDDQYQTKIASLSAHVILRDLLGASRRFGREMHVASISARLFSYLFDSQARLDKKYISDSLMRGTGVWGHELDRGSFLFVTDITVAESYRRQGIASRLLNEVLSVSSGPMRFSASRRRSSRPVVTTCAFAVVWPASSETHIYSEAALQMVQKVGFRRIGRSIYLCRALHDSTHPSLSLSAHEDAEPAPFEVKQPGPTADGRPSPYMTEALNQEYWANHIRPIHAIIEDKLYSDSFIVDALGKPMTEEERREICMPDSDWFNCTPLHLAASQCRPSVIEKLLSMGAGECLFARDTQGRTPLDCATEEEESRRDMQMIFPGVHIGGPEGGHDTALGADPSPAFQCRRILLTAMGQSAPAEERPRSRCTCRACIGYCFSSVMLHQIHCKSIYPAATGDALTDIIRTVHALETAVAVQSEMEACRLDQAGVRGELWPASRIPPLRFIPISIRQSGINAAFLHGYITVLRAIADLSETNLIPTPGAVIHEVTAFGFLDEEAGYAGSQAMQVFLGKGGKVEHALDAVLFAAQVHARLYWNIFCVLNPLQESGSPFARISGILGVRQCQNDDHYALVRAELDIAGDICGPYEML